MNYKGFYYRFYVIAALLLVCGCKSPPPPPPKEPEIREVLDIRVPLTIGILERLTYENNESDTPGEIMRFQLHLAGGMTLEREDKEQNSSRGPKGSIYLDGVRIREVITIKDQTEGQVVGYEDTGAAIILSVCFEHNEKNRLSFSSRKGDRDGYFYLAGPNRKVTYEEKEYDVNYSDEYPPYLLIKLKQSDIEKINSRTLEGRKVE